MDYEAKANEQLEQTKAAAAEFDPPLSDEAWLYSHLAYAITYALLSVSSAIAEASHQERP
jgi:hypothetical protein